MGDLKEKKLGHAALLIPKLTAAAPQSAQKVLPPQALAWATDKVRAPKPLEALVTRLLGDVVIFPELEHALECKKVEPALAMATLTGEYVSREGIVFTGGSEVRAASLLERKAQIADLAKEEAALAKERDSVNAKRDEAKTALETASRLQRELSEAGRKIDTLQSDKTALERQIIGGRRTNRACGARNQIGTRSIGQSKDRVSRIRSRAEKDRAARGKVNREEPMNCAWARNRPPAP